MPRIRTIKPEFPQSESMGRVSREARLCFILLWTIADDVGRLRGASRMLASLLYPYDEDARSLMDGWLDELERENCIRRYVVSGDSYIEVCNWLIHQKVDKPSKSKFPEFVEPSRTLANAREDSSGDQGSRIKDQGPGSRTKDRSRGETGGDGNESQDGSRAHVSEPPDSHEVLTRIKAVYPAGLHRGDHWLLAEREVSKLLDAGESADALVTAAAEYGAQQLALGNIGTGSVMRPSNFFNGSGAWRGPFPLPAEPPRPKAVGRMTFDEMTAARRAAGSEP